MWQQRVESRRLGITPSHSHITRLLLPFLHSFIPSFLLSPFFISPQISLLHFLSSSPLLSLTKSKSKTKLTNTYHNPSMANNNNNNEEEESNPLLATDSQENECNPKNVAELSSPPSPPPKEHPVPPMTEPHAPDTYVMGHPLLGRAPWSSSLCSCLGNHDHFFSTDLEVCLLGSVAPCVLYGTNAERLGSTSASFANHCLTYTALYLIGNSFFGWNCLAPWFSYTTRTALRRGFNLEGSCEALTRRCGCGGSFMEDDVQREQCEMACDFATHVFCHPCSLCQEGREIRRRLPHPGFNAQQVVVMIPPAEQTMGRHYL